MSSTSSVESAPSVSGLSALECEPSRSAKSPHTPAPSSASIGRMSLATTIFAPSPQAASGQMEFPWMSSAAASPAKISVSPGLAPALPDSEAASGSNIYVSLTSFDPDTSSWRTSRRYSPEAWTSFSGVWPRSGTMRSGTAYQRPTLARPMTGTGSGLLPTPSGVNGGKNHTVGRLDEWGGSSNPFRGTDLGRIRCASFEEWMMGLPIGFTELTPSETPSSRKSRKSSGVQS